MNETFVFQKCGSPITQQISLTKSLIKSRQVFLMVELMNFSIFIVIFFLIIILSLLLCYQYIIIIIIFHLFLIYIESLKNSLHARLANYIHFYDSKIQKNKRKKRFISTQKKMKSLILRFFF